MYFARPRHCRAIGRTTIPLVALLITACAMAPNNPPSDERPRFLISAGHNAAVSVEEELSASAAEADVLLDPTIENTDTEGLDYVQLWVELQQVANNFVPPVLLAADQSYATPYILGPLPGQAPLDEDRYAEIAETFEDGAAVVLLPGDSGGPDLWARIRNGFEFSDHDHPGAVNDLAWFASHQAYLNRTADRARPYLHFIVEEVERRGMPMEIALLPVVESAFQPFAYSHGRAAGIWQFIPSTGRLYGLKQNWWYDGRRDVVASTRAALTYLSTLQRHFDGDWLLALAAYNSGEGTVRRAIAKNRRKGKLTDYWHLDLPRETRGYVPKLLAIANIVSNPQRHGITLPAIDDEPYFTTVDINSQIDLALAAELAEVTLEDLYTLNPAYNRWATDPNGPHRLLLPVTAAEPFTARLAELPEDKRIHWDRHRIRKGETLLAIADRYGTTVELIKRVNNVKGNNIRAGQDLIIPVATKTLASYSLSADQRLHTAQQSRPSGHQKVLHVVREGESLWQISRKYGVGVRMLAKWNNMAPRDRIKSGQQLAVWIKGRPSAGTIRTARFSDNDANLTTQKIGYRVKRGDSLARISQKFKVSINDLMKWNRLRHNNLQPGQRLTLYVDVTAQAGNI